MMRSVRLLDGVCCLLAMLLAVTGTAECQDRPKDFPLRPITIQVGSVAGGSNDIGVRIVADSLKKVVGQPVLVENKAGAGGQVMLTDFKNNAKPDGYTLAVFVSPGYVTIPLDPARKAVLGGHVDLDCDNVGGFLPTVRSGQARILAVMADKRFPDLPDVPTFREQGIDLTSSSARGFIVPKGTPTDIVRYLEQALRKAMDDPDHVRRMKEVGLSVKFMDSEEIAGFIGREEARAKSLIEMYRK
jgi:tripartite-type tricarboxylate transporter receptor subunit TctC